MIMNESHKHTKQKAMIKHIHNRGRDGLKEQTLKESILQGKIRLTVKKSKKGGGRKESRERHSQSSTNLRE